MRVLVLGAATSGLGPRAAGTAVGRAFAQRGHQVALVPLAEHSRGLAAALADLPEPRPVVVPAARSAGELAAAVRRAGAATVLVDLGHDLEPDLTAGPAGPVPGVDLVGVTTAGDLDLPLLGVRGVAARAGWASGEDRALILERDAGYRRLAERLGTEPGPGSGAAGGAGLLVLALGGRLRTPWQVLAETCGLERTLPQADLVVLVLTALDFGGTGADLARAAAGWAEVAGAPCVVVAEQVVVSARELRTWGIEAGYGLASGDDLPALARRVATTWSG